jgi:EAL and modified HD-GYP domain-containing signal transduction protein
VKEKGKISRSVLLRLLKALMEQEDLKTVSQIASADPCLTAKILKFVNSAYANLQRPIHSVEDAIAYLGYRKLLEITTTLLATSLLSDKPPKEIKRFLRNAYIMKATAQRQAPQLKDEAFMVGVLYPAYEQMGEELLQLLKEAGVSKVVIDGFVNPKSPLWIIKEFALKFAPYCRKLVEEGEKDLPITVGGYKKEFLMKVCFDADIEAEKIVNLL